MTALIGHSLRHHVQGGVIVDLPPPTTAKPPKDRELFKDLHINELKSALNSITVQMASVRAKKHWQREELEVLKHHRKTISGCLSSLENSETVTTEQLLRADEVLDAYKHATS